MSETIARREALALLLTPALCREAHASARTASGPAFLAGAEFELLRVLAELTLPGAGAAKVPEFVDFVCTHSAEHATTVRNGLQWIDAETRRRTGQGFATASEEGRRALLELIAYRKNETAALSPGIAYFARIRELVVDGYYTSEAGIAAIGYQGNQVLTSFAPPEEAVRFAEEKLGG